MSPIEIAAFLLGLANVTLVVRRSIWNYPFALAMVSLYAVVFFREKLYSDAALQLFFFAVNLYGWWNWARARAESGEVRVRVLGGRARLGWIAGAGLATLGWGTLMDANTDAAYPHWDGAIAMLSVAGQILLSRRFLENWWFWIAVDLFAIPLFAVKGLWLTAALYLIFLALSVWGLVGWTRARHA